MLPRYITAKLGIIPLQDIQPLIAELKEISKMLTGLARSVKKSITDKPAQ